MTRRIGVNADLPRFSLVLRVVLLSGIACLPSTAQDKTAARTIQGKVFDQKGSPVSGAVVMIEDTKSLQVRSYITQSDGEYHFNGLNPELNYELRAQYDGTTSGRKTVSVFVDKQTVRVDLHLTKRILQKPGAGE